MSAKQPKQRTMTVGVYHCEVYKSWGALTIAFVDNRGEQRRKVVIEIERPCDIAYIRERLDEIEQFWRSELESIKP